MAASANNDTQQRARLALVDMAKHQVPITPSNYSLWYEHVVRANPDLSTSIDGVLRDGKAPDNVVLQGLYTQFFETEPVDVDETSREISHTLRETLDSVRLVLNGAGDGLGEYGQSLDEFVTKSRSDPSPDSTLRMVKALVAQTA
ncbi:MAG: diguanylate cyclase, partial [Gammaproteobacteria bacterium]